MATPNSTERSMVRIAEALERLGRVSAVMMVGQLGDSTLAKKAHVLRRAGFSNVDIAEMLDSTANAIGVALHMTKKKGKKAKKTKA